jgi:hypothetical protein
LTFTEQQGIASETIEAQFYHSTDRFRRVRKARFCQRHGQAPIRTIVRRLNMPVVNQFQHARVKRLLGFETDIGRRALLTMM